MFGTAIRNVAKKLKPKMGAVTLKTPPEQRQTITRTLFDIVKEHGPITVSNTWERVKRASTKKTRVVGGRGVIKEEAKVAEVRRAGGGRWGWELRWRRDLFE
ncbi:hypothetical protein L195_g035929 [Trifolium pratense]|uniref:Uncharacterized protein n=1 Tax=Trifolium pratense TaxID=57577 RepID=A0A2K3LN37_TRIPR|nr:hypothetical protein L195_g035929 [Trifolium pratense]